MFVSHFYSLSAVIIILGLVKVSLSRSGFSPLVTIFLGCTLSYCFFENGLPFFPFACYLFRDQVESFSLFLKKSFTTFKESFSFTGNQTEEKDGGAGQFVEIEKSGNETQRSTLWSPLEKGIAEEDRHSQLVNFGLALTALLAISRSCVGLLGKLAYTKRWVERMVSKGYPKFLFFWIPDSKQEPVSESSLFNLLLGIFVVNFLIAYFLFRTF